MLNRGLTSLSLFVALAAFAPVAQAADNTAPTGTYSTDTGGTCIAGFGGGAVQLPKSTIFVGVPYFWCWPPKGETPSKKVAMKVDSYTDQVELQQLITAQQRGGTLEFLKTLNTFNHGSVTIGDQTFPINGALSAKIRNRYLLVLFSGHSFRSEATPNASASTAGGSGTVIVLDADASMTGGGALLTSAGGFAVDPQKQWIVIHGFATGTRLVPPVMSLP